VTTEYTPIPSICRKRGTKLGEITELPNPRNALPPRQAQLLAFIDSELICGLPFPSLEKMRIVMGWKNQCSVSDCLYRLRWRGLLAQEKREKSVRWVRVKREKET
jgi:hypothetical protein